MMCLSAKRSRSARRNAESGTTLIEALVAFVILGIGLLGLLALQIKAQHADFESYQRSQALMMVEDMMNRIAARGTYSGYTTEGLESLPGEWTGETTPVSGQVSASDLVAWNTMLRGAGELAGTDSAEVGGLVGAVGCIQQDASDAALIYVSVAWQGATEQPLPEGVSSCGSGRYERETLRRVFTLPIYLK